MSEKRVQAEVDRIVEMMRLTNLPIKMNGSFFRDMKCSMCGACCRYVIILSENDASKLSETYRRVLEDSSVLIGNNIIKVYHTPLDYYWCPFLNGEKKCSIHYENKPIQCQLSFFRFKKVDKDCAVLKRVMGRAKQYGCHAKALATYDCMLDDLRILQHMKDVADEWGVRNNIDIIMDKIRAHSSKDIVDVFEGKVV